MNRALRVPVRNLQGVQLKSNFQYHQVPKCKTDNASLYINHTMLPEISLCTIDDKSKSLNLTLQSDSGALEINMEG